jgi:hypothetical protein
VGGFCQALWADESRGKGELFLLYHHSHHHHHPLFRNLLEKKEKEKKITKEKGPVLHDLSVL